MIAERLTFRSRLVWLGLLVLLVGLLFGWTPPPVRSTGQGGCRPVSLYLPVVLSDFEAGDSVAATAMPTAGCPNTATPTASYTAVHTATPSITPSLTPSATAGHTATHTPTLSVTPSLTPSATAGNTATPTPTPSVTPTVAPLPPGWHEVGDGSATGGGISDSPEGSWNPGVAIALDGTVYIAWDDAWGIDTDGEIYVRRWTGSSWEEVGSGSAGGGGISNNDGDSVSATVAVAPDGMVYVAWEDRSNGNPEIYVRRWNGSSWEEVGAGSAGGGGISNNSGQSLEPSIAIGPDGIPYIAWEDDSGGSWEIYVRWWNGSSWAEVGTGSAVGGGISNNSGFSGSPSAAVDLNGIPYVAWYNYVSGDTEIYVRRWNGSSWEEVGASSASGGGISNNSSSSYRPSVAIAPDGIPYIAWVDLSGGNSETYVRRWNGSSWEEVGAGSASGGGISNNAGETFRPVAAVAPDGVVYVAWHDDSSGTGEIYVRRWNGSSWEEAGVGSASGGGISNNPGNSGYPAIAIAADGRPYVTWEDSPEGTITELTDIYVLQWLEP